MKKYSEFHQDQETNESWKDILIPLTLMTPINKLLSTDNPIQKQEIIQQINQNYDLDDRGITTEDQIRNNGDKFEFESKIVKEFMPAIVYHEVKKGENLIKIATLYNSTPDALMEFNKLSDADKIQVGQVLRVKVWIKLNLSTTNTPATTQIIHKVQQKETLYSIARQYGVNVDDLSRLNGISDGIIRIGQDLKIPSGASTPPTPSASSNTIDMTHIVGQGDNLYLIARKYNTTVEDLKRINDMTSDNIQLGQKLKVKSVSQTPSQPNILRSEEHPNVGIRRTTPNTTPSGDGETLNGSTLTARKSSYNSIDGINYYEIQHGDNFFNLSKRFNISNDDLKNLNSIPLSQQSLKKGTVLRLNDKVPMFDTGDVKKINSGLRDDFGSDLTAQGFFDDLVNKESHGDYTVCNDGGFMGKYQIGVPALTTIANKNKDNPTLKDLGKITVDSFKKDPMGVFPSDLQDSAMRALVKMNIQSLNVTKRKNATAAGFPGQSWQIEPENYFKNYIGKTLKNVPLADGSVGDLLITESGLVAACHLGGPASVLVLLSTQGATIPHDANNVTITQYMDLYSGYDMSEFVIERRRNIIFKFREFMNS